MKIRIRAGRPVVFFVKNGKHFPTDVIGLYNYEKRWKGLNPTWHSDDHRNRWKLCCLRFAVFRLGVVVCCYCLLLFCCLFWFCVWSSLETRLNIASWSNLITLKVCCTSLNSYHIIIHLMCPFVRIRHILTPYMLIYRFVVKYQSVCVCVCGCA